ncbi:hypothetical protein A946_00165 [Methylacidiphilum kamchatkense Kam1]|uniref:Uncharacterized protein n=1 Tax=Methylacidiphilum kamchatkense Kam1 TaxID=1202785 RepID=A0A0C1USB6_9BACT|nr:hypothetical protein [Methylacidiphilum kamchatkense]KIE59189.1 hypothetical protein A946_00165 [Methylacidiphilum kamchatkense Kam1]QDQ42854.1 hypothetical protein kam1_1639 [Methylacidiphilum kamchatkense Kam1]
MKFELPIIWKKSTHQPHLYAIMDSKGKWIADVPDEQTAMVIVSSLTETMKKGLQDGEQKVDAVEKPKKGGTTKSLQQYNRLKK